MKKVLLVYNSPIHFIISIILALFFAEILFNADCQVALLLDSVKKSHNIPQSGINNDY